MSRRVLLVGLLVLTAFAGGAGGASTPRTLALAGPVSELAADGGRVAILLRTGSSNCARDRVAVWVPATRTFVPIGASACASSTSTGAGLEGVALAGKQVAYVQFAGGNLRELQLRLATLARPRPATAASAAFGLDAETGTYIGRVAGDGSLLAFDWWSQCAPCAQVAPVGPRSSVWRILPSGSACPASSGLGAQPRCRLVRALLGSLRLLAVGGGLVAMGSGDAFVDVRSADGTPLYSGVFPGTVKAARVDGDRLLVLTRSGAQNSLWTGDTHSSDGRRSGPWPLPASKSSGDAVCGDPNGCKLPALRLEDFQSGIVVYVVGRDVHLLRLSDKKEVKIRASGLGPVHAQLEASGLFYSYRPSARPGRGRVAFMPMATVLARFG
jgi:hypothetical protein